VKGQRWKVEIQTAQRSVVTTTALLRGSSAAPRGAVIGKKF